MTIEGIKEEDSLNVDVVVIENGVVKNLTGASVQAAVKSPSGVIQSVTASLLDAVNGVVRVTVPKDKFVGQGSWIVQCRVELGTESRTVYHEDVIVGESLIKDAP